MPGADGLISQERALSGALTTTLAFIWALMLVVLDDSATIASTIRHASNNNNNPGTRMLGLPFFRAPASLNAIPAPLHDAGNPDLKAQ
jgi:hypothetical protein